MDLEDFFSPEVGITAAVVGALASPQVRKILRRGAVAGLAGLLIAGDAIKQTAEGVGQTVQNAATQAQQNAAQAKQSRASAAANGATSTGSAPEMGSSSEAVPEEHPV
ncbi:MAG TPA: hypothetical protein VF116_07080 [Ktedonobacterales bacterium]